jgi:hypothetical protein
MEHHVPSLKTAATFDCQQLPHILGWKVCQERRLHPPQPMSAR